MVDALDIRQAEDAIERYLVESYEDLPPNYPTEIGDGDYRQIGAEFLQNMVRLGGLRPFEHVVDIGCGLGRMARPLQYFMNERGRYFGVDVSKSSIGWCEEYAINGDPRFGFSHLDAFHPLYNPRGAVPLEDADLQFLPRPVDFVMMVSVFTHLSEAMVTRYLAETYDMLRPGGRLFATFFLVNDENRDAVPNNPRYPFVPLAGSALHLLAEDALLAAVAMEETWLMDHAIETVGYSLFNRRRGHWWQTVPTPDTPFQDIVVFQK